MNVVPLIRLLWRSRLRVVMCGGLVNALMGCGTVGPPIPPEDVGLTPIIERQKLQETKEQEQGDRKQTVQEETEPPGGMTPTEQDEVLLPPLRPVGAR
ncbi:MAG: hypothetical protein ACT4OO_07420 [Nitrospiraceae bacterium]